MECLVETDMFANFLAIDGYTSLIFFSKPYYLPLSLPSSFYTYSCLMSSFPATLGVFFCRGGTDKELDVIGMEYWLCLGRNANQPGCEWDYKRAGAAALRDGNMLNFVGP